MKKFVYLKDGFNFVDLFEDKGDELVPVGSDAIKRLIIDCSLEEMKHKLATIFEEDEVEVVIDYARGEDDGYNDWNEL